MIKLAFKLVVTAAVLTVAWHGPVGNTVRNFVPEGTSFGNVAQAFDTTASLASGLTSMVSAAGVTDHVDHVFEVESCSYNIVVPTTGTRDGVVTDLRNAARDMTAITGVDIEVTRDDNPAADLATVPVYLIDNQKSIELNKGTEMYAAIIEPVQSPGQHAMVVNYERIYDLTRGTGTGTRYSIFLHELGHLVGYHGHSGKDGDLMHANPSLSAGLTDADREAFLAATAKCRA